MIVTILLNYFVFLIIYQYQIVNIFYFKLYSILNLFFSLFIRYIYFLFLFMSEIISR